MSYKPYSEKKQEFDDKVFLYIANRLFEDLDETDAGEQDIIDGVGNVLKNTDASNEWAFTSLDRLLLMMRQQVGEENLRQILQHYQFAKDIDPLFILSRGSDYDYSNLREVLGNIVTKVEDKSYLPDYLYHDEGEEYIEEEDGYGFNDKVRRALTVATCLLYSVRGDKVPSVSNYDSNVAPSVEVTFGVRPWGTYEDCLKFCEDHGLIQFDKITGEGIRLLVSLSKLFVEGNLLINDTSRIENQTRNWVKLANERL